MKGVGEETCSMLRLSFVCSDTTPPVWFHSQKDKNNNNKNGIELSRLDGNSTDDRMSFAVMSCDSSRYSS